MLRLLKKDKFHPHASSCYKTPAIQIIRKVTEYTDIFSKQIDKTGKAKLDIQPNTRFSYSDVSALANIITHELIYYHQLGEIGYFLASAFADYENDIALQDSSLDESDGENEDSDIGTPGGSPSSTTLPKRTKLSSSLLNDSIIIRKKIKDLFVKMGLTDGQCWLGPAGYLMSYSQARQDEYIGTLTHSILIKLGGCPITGLAPGSMTINEILTEITDIAKTSWSLMNFCAMCQAFRFAAPRTPLFYTLKIEPSETIFGNNGWTDINTFQQFQSIEIPK